MVEWETSVRTVAKEQLEWVRREIHAWVMSELGRTTIRKALDTSLREAERLQEARKIDLKELDQPIAD